MIGAIVVECCSESVLNVQFKIPVIRTGVCRRRSSLHHQRTDTPGRRAPEPISFLVLAQPLNHRGAVLFGHEHMTAVGPDDLLRLLGQLEERSTARSLIMSESCVPLIISNGRGGCVRCSSPDRRREVIVLERVEVRAEQQHNRRQPALSARRNRCDDRAAAVPTMPMRRGSMPRCSTRKSIPRLMSSRSE